MSIETYYKVIKVIDDQLQSAIGAKTGVLYKLNKVTKPNVKNSKLFVFKERHNAQNFANCQAICSSKPYIIYKCVVTNPRRADHITKSCSFSMMKDYWNTIAKAKKQHKSINAVLGDLFYENWPDGTYWCDSVTLTEKIQ